MRGLFLTTLASSALLVASIAAHAADMPVKAKPAPPPAPLPPPFSWTGFYVGGNVEGERPTPGSDSSPPLGPTR